MSAHVEVRLVCSGRGQHDRLLAVFAPEPPRDDAGVWVGDAEDLRQASWDKWELVSERNRGHGVVESKAAEKTGEGWRLWCTSCRRGWLIPDDALGAEVVKRARARVSQMDLNPKRC